MGSSRQTPPPYWFPLKGNGFGWGPPVTRQGRLLMTLLVVPLVVLLPAAALLPAPAAAVLAVVTAAVCLPTFFVVASRHAERWVPDRDALRGPQPPTGRAGANTDGRLPEV